MSTNIVSSTNSIADALASAKPLKAKKPAVQQNSNPGANNGKKTNGQPPAKPASESEGPSLRDRLRATTQAVRSATELRTTLRDASECQGDKEIIGTYVEVVDRLDELATYIFGQTMPVDKAKEKWLEMDWDAQEAQLKEWAEGGNDIAKGIISELEPFNSNSLLREFLRRVFVDFVTPLRWVNTWAGLRRFLDELVEAELAKPINRPNRIPENGVLVPGREFATLYLPNRGVKVSEGGWTYVQEAAGRIKAIEDQIDSLRQEATPGLTPVKISQKQQGLLFLRLGGTQAVLLDAFEQGGWMTVQISKAVGMREDQLPKDAVLWDDKVHRPQNSGKWSWINQAMDKSEDFRRRSAALAREEHNQLLSPIMGPSNMSSRFEDGGLLQLIEGHEGVLAIWNNKFQWGDKGKTGLLGVALKREGNNFVLLEVVTDFHFPKGKLLGENLPVVFDPGRPLVKMNHKKPREDKDVYDGLEMLCRLLYLRLKAELRFAKPEAEQATGEQAQ